MNQVLDSNPSDIPTEGKPGTYTPDYTIRAAAPVILFDTKAPTDLDPNSIILCQCCGVWIIDCPNEAQAS